MIRSIDTQADLKILGDNRRLVILRLLMKSPATLSQLGEKLEMSPARIRYHLKILELAGFVELVSTNIVRGFVEKYYQAAAKAFVINQIILPDTAGVEMIYAFCSHDPVLDLVAKQVNHNQPTPNFFCLPVGSLEGLSALRQGFCHITGCHLYDPISTEFNTSYVRHFFPGQRMHVITLANRLQGILVKSGNPKNIRDLNDLVREDVIFVNRNKGSGTRIWLERQIAELSLDQQLIRGYQNSVETHNEVAARVRSGAVDAGLAVAAVADKENLDFIPQFQERYDLVIPDHEYAKPIFEPFLEILNSKQLRAKIEQLVGYESNQTGQENLIS